jgi:hypothetical protein
MAALLEELMELCPHEINYHGLSLNPNFKIEWLKKYPAKSWNLENIIRNKNFKLEWVANNLDLKWPVDILDNRLKKGDILMMPKTISKIINIRSWASSYSSFYLDSEFIWSYSFEKEEKLLKQLRIGAFIKLNVFFTIKYNKKYNGQILTNRLYITVI